MNACATIDAATAMKAGGALNPIVLVDGVVERRLHVTDYEATSPLDERTITLAVDAPIKERRALMRRWRRALSATVIWPARLMDEQVRPIVLAHGRLRVTGSDRQRGRDSLTLELVDDWTEAMAKALEGVWKEIEGRAVLDARAGRLRIGGDANRSTGQHEVSGRMVHLPATRGETWTVAHAVATVLAMANHEVSLLLLPDDIASAPLIDEVDLAQPVGDILRRIMAPHRLVIERAIRWRGGRHVGGGQVLERRAVRSSDQGRLADMAWPARGASSLSIESRDEHDGARLWEARARGWRVESTFALSPAWDPSLESVSDAELDRATSSDFAAVANVFRLWVLNEDGQFSDSPFSVARFNAAALFDLDVLDAQPLRLLPCVTLDDSGEARSVMLEVSVDSGVTWSTYAGRWMNRVDRAVIYLDDAALDAAFLTAARAGTVRLRVTGSLQSPAAVTTRRWRGNAFMGEAQPHVIDTGDAFLFRRVDAQSVHFDAVRGGLLNATESDDRAALARYLVDRMADDERMTARTGRAKLTVSGAWPMANIGDRVMNAGGRGVNAQGESQAVDERSASVRSVTMRWQRPGPRSTKAAPITELELEI